LRLAEVLGRFAAVEPERDGWVARCPHPDHGRDGRDQTPSLRLAVSGLKVLVKCRVGCPTAEVLAAVGLGFGDLVLEELPADTPRVRPRRPGAPLDFWDEVYSQFLRWSSLAPADRARLEARGFDREHIQRAKFRSLDGSQTPEVLRTLHGSFGPRLFQVPGFTRSLRLPWGLSGLVIPVRDASFRVVALKVRLPGDLVRYRYFSTPEVSCGTPAHHPVTGKLPPLVGPLWITEGELKAELCSWVLKEQFVSVPGVALWRRALDAVRHWRPRGPVVVAFDWPDVGSKHGVRVCLEELIRALRARGLVVKVAWWATSAFKGLDDLLAKGELPEMADPETLGLAGPSGPEAAAPLPLDFFPRPVQEYLENIAGALPCPVDFPAVAALVVAGASLGTSRRLEMYPGWEEYPACFAASVGAPGVLKSPATKRPVRPVVGVQDDLQREFEELRKEFLQRLERWRARRTVFQKALRSHYESQTAHPPELEPTPERPRVPSVLLMDYTLEALTSLLKDSPRGVLLFLDELVAWVRSMDQYRGGKGSDRTFFMKSWSCESHRVDRKSTLEDPIWLKKPFVAVLGTIQPEILPDLLDPRGRDDGFGDRLLYAFPQATPGSARPTTTESSELAATWARGVRALRGFDFAEHLESRAVRPTHEALELWAAWHDGHVAQQTSEHFPEALPGPWSKFKAYSARFSLIAHALRLVFPDPEVLTPHEFLLDPESVRRGLLLTEYFKAHRRRVQLLFGDTELDRRVRSFVTWMQRHGLSSTVVRDLYRRLAGRFGIRGRDDCVKLLRAVEDRGWGTFGTELGRNQQERLVFTLGPAAPVTP
jgi:hypothetical protein